MVEAGAGVSRLPAPTGAVEAAPVVGRDVCALTNGGGYAEFVTVPAGQVLPLPAQTPGPVRERHMVRAAAIPEAAMTVWNNVFLRGRLGVGSVFLAHGGAGGVGSFAVRMARAAGAIVVTTAATRERGQWCQSLGAHVPIAYEAEDFAAVLKEPGWKARLAECRASLAKETPAIRCPDPAPTGPSGDGVDVILDIVGGAYLPKNVEVLGTEGRCDGARQERKKDREKERGKGRVELRWTRCSWMACLSPRGLLAGSCKSRSSKAVRRT